MLQAVVRLGRSQYLVSEGDEILVDKGQKGGEVLLVIDGEQVTVGQPTLKAKIAIQEVGLQKGKKVRTATFKAKSRYRKLKGFRPVYSRLKIGKITWAKS